MEKRLVSNMYLLNAIIGDVCGSHYEFWKNRIKYKPESLIRDECEFTDDTVLTCAVAEALMTDMNFKSHILKWALKYPDAGYGSRFIQWMKSEDHLPYNSYGNGSAMRVSPCAYYRSPSLNNLSTIILASSTSASVTHNHHEGMLGAAAVTLAIFYARIARSNGYKGNEIKEAVHTMSIAHYLTYNFDEPLDNIRPKYKFNETCQGSVPQSIQCVLEAEDYEDAIKLAISMGGDSDTMACIAGSIAGVIWDKPEYLCDWVLDRLPDDIIKVILDFDEWVSNREKTDLQIG